MSAGIPQSMRHLMNEFEVPIYPNNPATVSPSIDKQTDYLSDDFTPS